MLFEENEKYYESDEYLEGLETEGASATPPPLPPSLPP